jgi:hypothetical protein
MVEKTTPSVAIAPEGTQGPRDLATIIAISIIAFAIANVLHEPVGHGGACALMGGHAKVLSSVHFECGQAGRFIAAGGTLVNFIAGILCWLALRLISPARGHLRYLTWSSAQMRALERHASKRTDLRLYPRVKTNNLVLRCLPVCGSRTRGPLP